MCEVRRNPSAGTVLLVVVGGAFALEVLPGLIQGASQTAGTTASNNLVGQVNQVIGQLSHAIVGNTDGTAVNVGPNAGPSQFNFNAAESWAAAHQGQSAWGGHAAFGHVGTGGTYTLVMEVRGAGIFGIGQTDFRRVGTSQFTVNVDQDWTGYGVDFWVSFADANDNLNHLSSMDMRYSIVDAGGTVITSLTKLSDWKTV